MTFLGIAVRVLYCAGQSFGRMQWRDGSGKE
jgi:hypothetical protein